MCTCFGRMTAACIISSPKLKHVISERLQKIHHFFRSVLCVEKQFTTVDSVDFLQEFPKLYWDLIYFLLFFAIMATLEHSSKISASTDQPSLTTMVHCIHGIANELQYHNLLNFNMYFMCTTWCHFMDKQTHQKLYRSHQSREKSIANDHGHLDILWTKALPIHEARLQRRLLRIKQIVFLLASLCPRRWSQWKGEYGDAPTLPVRQLMFCPVEDVCVHVLINK